MKKDPRRGGNPNPVPRPENLTPHQFKPGQSGNPGGKSREQMRLERENALLALELRNKMLKDVTADVEQNESSLSQIRMTVLRLLKEAEDRGLGTPVRTVDLQSGGSPLGAKLNIDPTQMSDDTLRELQAALTGALEQANESEPDGE